VVWHWFHQGINAMMSALHASALVPAGLRVAKAACDGVATVLTLHPISMASPVRGRHAETAERAFTAPESKTDCKTSARLIENMLFFQMFQQTVGGSHFRHVGVIGCAWLRCRSASHGIW